MSSSEISSSAMNNTPNSGLQATAIYWENWQTPFRGLFGGLYGEKWTWKIVDDHIRGILGLPVDQRSSEALTFMEPGTAERYYSRKYVGQPEISEIVATKQKLNFSFFPTANRSF